MMTEKKVLVVDDEDIIREMLEIAFTRFGYIVRLAEDAEKALDILREEKIQVMFLDINMPGMNGLELCRKIRAEFPKSIIHALTGHGSLFELADCREAGFDDYFKKPVNLEVLDRAAKDAFEKIDTWNMKEDV